MRNLLAILFHRLSAPEKSESPRAPKQADSFAKVLQASLGDSPRDSHAGLASASPASGFPQTEAAPTPVADVAQDGQAENLLASQQIASPRDGRDKAEVGLKAAGRDGTTQNHGTRPGQQASSLPPTHRGTDADLSKPSTHDGPAGTRSERAQILSSSPQKPEAAPADQRSGGMSLGHSTATPSHLPDSGAKPATTDHLPSAPQATATPPRSAADTVEPSGEKRMPPHTHVVVNAPASPGVANARPGAEVRPQVWGVASEAQPERPIPPASKQSVDSQAPASTLDLVAAGPTDLDAAATQPESQATQAQAARPSLPVSKHPTVAKLAKEDPLVDSGNAPALVPTVSASPEDTAPAGEPVSGPGPSTVMPAVSLAQENAPLPTQADPTVAVAQKANASEHTEFTQPHFAASAPAERLGSDLPSRPSWPHPETPRGESRPRETAVSPVAVAPKGEGAHPVAPQASPSSPPTSFVPKVETAVKPSAGVSDDRPTRPARPQHNGPVQAAPLTTSTTPQAAPLTTSTTPEGTPLPVSAQPTSRPLPNQKPAVADSHRTPEATPSSPAAPDFVALPTAKPSASEVTFITQAAIEPPQSVNPPASAQPVAIPSLPERKPTSTTMQAQASQRHHVAQAIPAASQSVHENTRHARPAAPVLEGPQQGARTPSTPEETYPSPQVPPTTVTTTQAHPGDAPRPGVEATSGEHHVKPSTSSRTPASIENRHGESGKPMVLDLPQADPNATAFAPPAAPSGASESKVQAPELPKPGKTVRSAPKSAQDTGAPTPTSVQDPASLQGPVPSTPTSDQAPIPSAPTSLQAPTPHTPSGQAPIPSTPTDTLPAARGRKTMPSPGPDMGTTLPVQAPVDAIAQPSVPALASGQTRVASQPRSQATPERPEAPKPNRGEQVVPLAQHPQAEPTTLVAESAARPETEPGLPVVEDGPASATAPSEDSPPQPKADHAPQPTGTPNLRSAHPASHRPHPEKAAKLVDPNVPSPAPQVDGQSATTTKAEDGPSEQSPVSTAPTPALGDAPRTTPSVPPQPVAPPVVTAAPAQPDQPLPRPDALPLAAAPVAAANPTQAAPIAANAPALSTPLPAEDTRVRRRPWDAKDDSQVPETTSLPNSAQAHQAHPPVAPAPHTTPSHDKRDSAGNQSPSDHTSRQTAPVPATSNDRPAEISAPATQASPSPSDSSAVAPAPVSPPSGHAPPVEVRQPHLPNHMMSMAAQAARDDGLNMTVMPHAAHMSIESRDGDLALHLRVRDGSADVTVAGSMAPLFEARAPEARAALASEGLNLGRFDLGQQGGGNGGQQGQPAPERHERAPEPATPYRQQSNHHEPAPGDGRIHVTA